MDEKRPTLGINLRNGDKTIKTFVLLDTGADITLLHGYLATALGVDCTNAPGGNTTVLGVNITYFEAPIQIGMLRKFYETRVYFSFDLPFVLHGRIVYGMLGHHGFLDRIDAHVDNQRRRISLQEHEVLHRKLYRYCPVCGKERKTAISLFCGQCGTSLIVPSSVVNGYITQPPTANTPHQTPVSLSSHSYPVASTMQVQSGQEVPEEDKEEI